MKTVHRKNLQAGFSLIEILISLVILTMVGLVVTSFQKDIVSMNRMLSSRLNAQDEMRKALKMLTAEVRTASPSSLGAYAIVQATSTIFSFYSDIDNDSLKERVTYFLESGTLKKGVIKPTGTPLTYNSANEVVTQVVHYMNNGATPIFSYYDENYDGTTQPLSAPINISSIRLLKVTLITDKDTLNPPAAMTTTTQISMRNLKDNL